MQSISADIQAKWPIDELSDFHSLPKALKGKKQKTEDIVNQFRAAVEETFLTKESELSKYKPNDTKESGSEDK